MRNARLLLLSIALVGCSEAVTSPAINPAAAPGRLPPPPLDGQYSATLSVTETSSGAGLNPAVATAATTAADPTVAGTYYSQGSSRYLANQPETNYWISFDGDDASPQARVHIHQDTSVTGSGTLAFTNLNPPFNVVKVQLAHADFVVTQLNRFCTISVEGGQYPSNCAVIKFHVVDGQFTYDGEITAHPNYQG